MGGKENGEEKEQEVVARVLSRFKPKEVRRRETTNQWRRRTSQQDTNKDLLFERLRWINLLTYEHSLPSSSTKKQYKKTSFVSHTQSQASITNLQPFKGISSQEAKAETEMMITTKSFPLPVAAHHKAKLYESSSGGYSNQIPFSDRGRFSFVGGCNRLAPAVQIRSVIPVFAAPASKPNPSPSTSSINSCSVPKTPGLGGHEKNLTQTKIVDQTHD